MSEELTIEDLAKRSRLSQRTLRYYIQEGLLPGPDSMGKYARYSQEHLDRLEIIRRLKHLRLPLSEIRHLLDNMTPAEVDQVLHYQDALNANISSPDIKVVHHNRSISDDSSALDYIRKLEMTQGNLRALAGSPGGYPPPKSIAVPPAKPRAPEDHQSETWTRIALADGVELNVRAAEASRRRKEIADLVRYAGKLFATEPKRGGQS